MVDMRMRRSNLQDVGDLKEGMVNTRRTGPGSRSSVSTTTGPPESVRALTSGQDIRAGVPSILRAGGGSNNTSPVPPPRGIVAPKPASTLPTPPPPPPPLEVGAGFVTPPPPPGFVPPPPPPPLVAGSRESPSFPESHTLYSDNNTGPDGYVPPPMPTFKDMTDGHSPTPSSDPPSRSSSPAVGGNHRSGMPQRGMPVRGLRGRGGPRLPAPSPTTGRRDSYGQQTRPQTPPSPGNRPYNPSAHRRSGSGSTFARRTMASDAEVN